jgi:signal transduction histidine kinase
MIAVVSVAVALFTIPLAITVRNLTIADELGELEHAAIRAERTVTPGAIAGTDRAELPSSTRELLLAVYDRNGRRRAGDGPTQIEASLRTVYEGRTVSHRGRVVAVAIPVTANEAVIGAVRASAPGAETAARIWRAWFLMLLSGLGAITLGGLLAWWQARRLAAPLGRLAAAARRIGHGDFTSVAPRSGLGEIDDVAGALDATAGRLGAALQRERSFSADASHQLRTPLSALRLDLEFALLAESVDRVHVEDALTEVDRLTATIEDLLVLARDTHGDREVLDVGALFDEIEAEWHGRLAAEGRPLRIARADNLPPVRAAEAAARQILSVMVNNAVIHGAGVTTVTSRLTSDWVALDVADEGPGFPGDLERAFMRRPDGGSNHGIGLALARALAEAEGGRLVVSRPGPHPIVSLLLPT